MNEQFVLIVYFSSNISTLFCVMFVVHVDTVIAYHNIILDH